MGYYCYLYKYDIELVELEGFCMIKSDWKFVFSMLVVKKWFLGMGIFIVRLG